MALAFVALQAAPWPASVRRAACLGVLLAWGACSAGTLGLAFGLASGGKGFWLAFGLGMLVRLAVLGALMGWLWMRPGEPAMAWLGGYAVGAAGLMMAEFRHFRIRTGE